MSVKGVTGPIEPYFDELKYWNHGDNPVYKKFMKIGMENAKGRQMIDHRTHVLDRGVRYISHHADFLWLETLMISSSAISRLTLSCVLSVYGLLHRCGCSTLTAFVDT